MKTRIPHVAFVIVCVRIFLLVPGSAQETPTPPSAFAFQGTLTSDGAAANGPHDLEFRLYDSESGFAFIGSPVSMEDVPVDQGRFSVILDFGLEAFDGNPRWIEVSVRKGAETGGFTSLLPRQPVNPAPYAIRALSAAAADSAISAANLEGLSSAGFWRAGGNTGTDPETDYVGTTDAAPLVFRANNLQVLRLEAAESGTRTIFGPGNTIDASSNNSSIMGGLTNSIADGAHESTIVAGQQNVIGATQRGAVIGGGARNQIGVDNQYASIGGGRDNSIGTNSRVSAIAGGAQNVIGDNVDGGFIGGGFRNDILGSSDPNPLNRQIAPLILGGSDNEIGRRVSGASPNVGWGVILGGDGNRIGNDSGFAVIAGGLSNWVADNCPYSFAAGRRARVNHEGAFVWADGQNLSFPSAGVNTFNIRAAGGIHVNADTSQFFGSTTRQMLNLWSTIYGIGVQSSTLYFRTVSDGGFSWHGGGTHSDSRHSPGAGGAEMMRLNSSALRVNGTFVSASDRGMKENFQPVDPQTVLEKVAALPLSEWSFKSETGTRHIGPMAQDFHAAFGFGDSDRHIATVDADGVALAAIQGLNQRLEEKQGEVDALRERVERLEQVIATLTGN